MAGKSSSFSLFGNKKVLEWRAWVRSPDVLLRNRNCPNALVETRAFSSRLPDANIEVVAGSCVLFSSLQLGDIRYYCSLFFFLSFSEGISCVLA